MPSIGILTGGGDVPGLNSVIKTVATRAHEAGMRVMGIRRGWAGLLGFDPESDEDQSHLVDELTWESVRTVARSGGTFLHSSRLNPDLVAEKHWPAFVGQGGFTDAGGGLRDYTPHILKVIEHLGLDHVIAIGGDGTLRFAARLASEGVSVMSVPKTMDNDVYGTDLCVGFPTAVTRSVDLISALRTNAGSHERIAVVELFGRYSGETSLFSAYLADVDRAIISEVPFDMERLAGFLARDRDKSPSNYAIMTISEGARMLGGDVVADGERDVVGRQKLGGVGLRVKDAIKTLTGHNVIYQQLAYLMRSGEPTALDRMLSISFANLAMDCIERRDTRHMTALRDGKYSLVPASTLLHGRKQVDVASLYDAENYRPRVQSTLGKPLFLY